MPRIVGIGPSRIMLSVIVLIILFCFTPLSRTALRAVDGSFASAHYSSLALRNPADAVTGVIPGKPVPVQLTNHTGRTETYHWSATQKGNLISLGEETLSSGENVNFSVPSQGAVAGKLNIALTGTTVFVTVPIVRK
jgi:hypothetical protein